MILENDLDLREKELAPIPTFSGTFLGSGHCITGVRISGSGNVRGLFRYIRSGAQVRDLTVEGTIHPSGRQDKLGLLAGSNAGQVSNCSAVGTVAGDNYVGGLIGVNEQGGQVIGGRFSGSVTGKHFVGGAAGANYGTLTRCDNSGSINTKDLEDDPKTDYMDLRQLNSMENVAVYTDIGGVVGLSGGTVQSCTNSGAVGSDQDRLQHRRRGRAQLRLAGRLHQHGHRQRQGGCGRRRGPAGARGAEGVQRRLSGPPAGPAGGPDGRDGPHRGTRGRDPPTRCRPR